MAYLAAIFVLSALAPGLGASFDKIDKGIALVEREKSVATMRGLERMLGQFKRALSGVRSDLSGEEPANTKAVAAKVGSLQRQAELVHRILQRAEQEKLQEQWLGIRREIDVIGAHVGVEPKLEAIKEDSVSTLTHDTEKLQQRVKRFHDSLKGSRGSNVQKIRFHANDVAFQLGRLVPMARRGSSKAKDMQAAWTKLWPELNALIAASKRYLPHTHQREAAGIEEECKELKKRYP